METREANSSQEPAPDLKNPYALTPEAVMEPPRRMGGILRKIGPGMILAASIVGSGELIATTTLGAQEGFIALWIIILSCLIKPGIQAELGRYTIATGETGLESLNRVPGPRLRVNWVVWGWAIMVLFTLLQVGAMFGGTAEVLHIIVPSVPVWAWVLVLLGATLGLLLGGGYGRVESLAMLKVGLFTFVTVLAAFVLVRMPEHVTWEQFASGFTFDFPSTGLATAVAVFGVTGVGATELFMYPYWCVEKGYARFTGKRDGSPGWKRRADGWVRVMHVDILVSLLVYTLATIAFYLLGAGILHGMGLVPSGKEMIPTLSNLYTKTLGQWSLWVFYIGAFMVLYSTIFASTAANSRLYADMCRLMGAFDGEDYRQRVRWRNGFVLFLTVVPVALYFTFQSPVAMVVVGGVAQALMLPVVAIGALYLRHKHLPKEMAPPKFVTAGLWVTAIIIVLLMGYYAVLTAQKLFAN